jgi:hypothetical protein
MKRPIAMRCSKEQFDSIKDRLPKDKIVNIKSFIDYNCISNFYEESKISNIGYNDGMYKYIKIHETFNADIFLEACGIEVEEIWKGNEMQYKDNRGNWHDCGNQEYRLKPQLNYDKEIEALEQKAKENGQSVTILFEKL